MWSEPVFLSSLLLLSFVFLTFRNCWELYGIKRLLRVALSSSWCISLGCIWTASDLCGYSWLHTHTPQRATGRRVLWWRHPSVRHGVQFSAYEMISVVVTPYWPSVWFTELLMQNNGNKHWCSFQCDHNRDVEKQIRTDCSHLYKWVMFWSLRCGRQTADADLQMQIYSP